MSKPHNYSQMSLTERRQWDEAEREKDDAEYAARDAAEKAERAERDLRRAKESYRSEVNDFNDRIDRLQTENEELEDERNEAVRDLGTTRTALEFLRDFIAREEHTVQFLTWYRLTNMRSDGTENESDKVFILVHNLFDPRSPDDSPDAEKGGE